MSLSLSPAFVLIHLEVCPFHTTLWYLSDKTLSISCNKSPFMPLRLNIYNSPSWKALYQMLCTPHTSREGVQSNALSISCVFNISCWTHESPGIKPDWFGERRYDLLKYFSANWEQGNWSVSFNQLLINFFVN